MATKELQFEQLPVQVTSKEALLPFIPICSELKPQAVSFKVKSQRISWASVLHPTMEGGGGDISGGSPSRWQMAAG